MYDNISEVFKERFVSYVCVQGKKVVWPKGFGVYVVWEIHTDKHKLIYVGLTGKFKKTQDGGYAINSGKFSNRINRWTPYLFLESDGVESGYAFKYGPKYSRSKEQYKNRFNADAYSNSISYDSLRIDFFVFSKIVTENYEYTPSLLEAQLLTDYLIKNNALPPANFEI